VARAVTGALPASYPHRLTWWVFLILLVSAAVFIVATSGQLPSLVASHFDAAGRPNGFMSRGGYVRFMLCFAVGLPLVVVFVLRAV
jgi:uncharacterized membrane protein